MSDVRVPIEKEYDNPKRRPGANGFNELLSGRGSSIESAASPYSLMSDFIDHAFEGDCKLDQNELGGMKLLAGYEPSTAKPCPPPTVHPAPAPAPPVAEENCPTAEPPKCPPEAMSPKEFMQEVGKRAIDSTGCAGAESKMIDQATRLTHARRDQQTAYLDKLTEFILSGQQIDDEEAASLDNFVDDLLRQASVSHEERAPRRTHPPSQQVDHGYGPSAFHENDGRNERIDSWIRAGSLSIEAGELAKKMR
jgi:hypothetical protein